MKKIIKNIRKIAITMLCMMTMLNCTVYAAEGTVFQVKSQEGKAGEMVTVPIEMHSGEDVGGFELTVYYDKDTLEFESLSKGNLIISDESNGLFDYNHKADNASIKIVYVVADTIKADGVIANIKFKLKKDCGEELPIGMGIEQVVDNSASSNEIGGEVSGVNADFQKQIDSQNGTTTDEGGDFLYELPKANDTDYEYTDDEKDEVVKGDVTGDGKVDIQDLRMILRYVCGKIDTWN